MIKVVTLFNSLIMCGFNCIGLHCQWQEELTRYEHSDPSVWCNYVTNANKSHRYSYTNDILYCYFFIYYLFKHESIKFLRYVYINLKKHNLPLKARFYVFNNSHKTYFFQWFDGHFGCEYYMHKTSLAHTFQRPLSESL